MEKKIDKVKPTSKINWGNRKRTPVNLQITKISKHTSNFDDLFKEEVDKYGTD